MGVKSSYWTLPEEACSFQESLLNTGKRGGSWPITRKRVANFSCIRTGKMHLTCGMIFFSRASLNSGGGGRSRPSMRKVICDFSWENLGCSPGSSDFFPFPAKAAAPGLIGVSVVTSNSPWQNKVNKK
jgi:hypothetical protein